MAIMSVQFISLKESMKILFMEIELFTCHQFIRQIFNKHPRSQRSVSCESNWEKNVFTPHILQSTNIHSFYKFTLYKYLLSD